MAPADFYDEVEAIESFDDLEFADEAKLGFRPGRRVFAAGGLASATLHTPKGPAKLSLPAPVPTLTQFRTLEQAVNATTQRLNTVNAELVRVRRELATRRRDPQGQGTWGMLFPLMMQKQLRDDLEGHTHVGSTAAAVVPTGGGAFSSLLPLLLLQPGIFGQQGSGTGGQETISPLLLILLFMDR